MTIRWLLNNIINGYIYSTIIVLAFSFIPKLKDEIKSYLNVSNRIILIILVINFIFRLSQMSFFTNEYKSGNLKDLIDTSFLNHLQLVMTFFLGFLLHLFFIFKKIRQAFIFSFISILALFILINFVDILIFIFKHNSYLSKEILPYFFNNSNLISATLFLTGYFLLSLFITKITNGTHR